ncbi:MAG: hypothetical protein V1822_01450 [Candidatus Micrarchaeota archaeon]
MDFSAKQIGVYALIAVFIFSTIAIYMGGFAGSGQQAQQIDPSKIISGYASANVTLSSYDPLLEVDNANNNSLQIISALKKSGDIIQQIKTSSSILITASNSSRIPYISRLLASSGATTYADATISAKEVYFSSDSGTEVLKDFSYRAKMQPVFEEGEQFPITFSASVLNGELYTYSSPSIVPQAQFSLWVKPLNATINSTSVRIEVPWSSRNITQAQIEAVLGSQVQTNFSPRSFVSFDSPVSEQILSQISLSKPPYITSLQPNSFSISGNFTDSAQIVQDLSQYGITPSFPPSYIELSDSQNATLLAQEIAGSTLLSGAQVSASYVLELVLPPEVDYGSKRYSIAQQSVMIESQTPPSDDYSLLILATPIGSKITQYSVSAYGPDLLSNPSAQQSENGASGAGAEPLSPYADYPVQTSDAVSADSLPQSQPAQNSSNDSSAQSAQQEISANNSSTS